MTERDDAELFARFSRRFAEIERLIEEPPPWRPPVIGRPEEPRTRGRSNMAWSASKVAASVAIIALGAGVLFLNAPRTALDGRGTIDVVASPSPSVSPSPAASIIPSGDLATVAIGTAGSMFGGRETPTVTTDDHVWQYRDWTVKRPLTMSDPRLTGTLTIVSNNSDVFGWPSVPAEDGLAVQWGTMLLEAGTGSWEGSFSGAYKWDGETGGVPPEDLLAAAASAGSIEMAWLEGRGTNEGLSVWLHLDWPPTPSGGATVVVTALIFPGSPPPDR